MSAAGAGDSHGRRAGQRHNLITLGIIEQQELARIFIDNGYVIPARKTFARDYVTANTDNHPATIELLVEAEFQLTRVGTRSCPN